jgi:hypothetical protein
LTHFRRSKRGQNSSEYLPGCRFFPDIDSSSQENKQPPIPPTTASSPARLAKMVAHSTSWCCSRSRGFRTADSGAGRSACSG